jgi:hypothetical protein
MYDFHVGKVYSFNTAAPSLLGASIKNAKMLGKFDYSTALMFDNIDLKYRTIYPLLPTGTPDDPNTAVYYRFLSESGEKIIICHQWVVDSTVEIIEHINFTVRFVDTSTGDIKRVRDALNALGYTNYTIKQV